MEAAFTYDAEVVRWVDGDTVDLRIDLGFHIQVLERFRLFGIDTPERGKPLASEATRFCEEQAPAGSMLVAKTYKNQDKYGRYLAWIETPKGVLNEALIDMGLAQPYFGGTK